MNHENIAILIDPERTYEVSYWIDNEGKKHHEISYLLGKDLTENQILELKNKGLIG